MAKAQNLEPYKYLKDVFTRLPNAQTVEDIDGLLPWVSREKEKQPERPTAIHATSTSCLSHHPGGAFLAQCSIP
tara:strand:+ start:1217 stop:1438 length:222 start_codon:yes stop_codon:yes gene_type:complete